VVAYCSSQVGNSSWPETIAVNLEITGTCQLGFYGSPKRTCEYSAVSGGIWSTISNPCSAVYCAADNMTGNATWPQTQAFNQNVNGICKKGWYGNPVRSCSQDGSTGNWGSVLNPCQTVYCAADNLTGNATWPQTQALNQTVNGSCKKGWYGNPVRNCIQDRANGTWGVLLNSCQPVYCAADNLTGNATWPQTQAFDQTVNGICNGGSIGNPTRNCTQNGANGTWGVVFGSCQAVTNSIDQSVITNWYQNLTSIQRGSWNLNISVDICRNYSSDIGWVTCDNDFPYMHIISISLANIQLISSIPSQLGELSFLQTLNLDNNYLTSTIPSQLEQASLLQILNLENNELYGTIPTELASLNLLQTLNLAANILTGTIPSQFSELGSLQNLFLEKNQLTGTIPIQLKNLISLKTLYLGGYGDGNVYCPYLDYQSWTTFTDYDPQSDVSTCFTCNYACPPLTACVSLNSSFINCQEFYCAGDSTSGNATWYPSQALGEIVNGSCNPSYYGNPTRICSASGSSGVWSNVSNPCIYVFCPASNNSGNASWPEVSALNQTIDGKCFNGYYGNPTRNCTQNGVNGSWSSVSDPCFAVYCPAENNTGNASWAQMLANGMNISGTCLPDYVGTPTRICYRNDSIGYWSTVSDPCFIPECFAETDLTTYWPFTEVNMTANGTCLIGFTGNPSRMCLPLELGSAWSENITNPCQDINECALNISDCDLIHGYCVNTFGSYLCYCDENLGYYGNGTDCTIPCYNETFGNASWPMTFEVENVTGSCLPNFAIFNLSTFEPINVSPIRSCDLQESGFGYIWGTLQTSPCLGTCADADFKCLNGGICITNVDTNLPYCYCVNTGFSGIYCEISECGPNGCFNGGKCNITSGICNCTGTLFTGDYCDKPTITCSPNPCQNGGICTEPEINEFSCSCNGTLFTGNTCSTPTITCSSNPCQNGGICTEVEINQIECDCNATQYVGQYCQEDPADCVLFPCQNGGSCNTETRTCSCPSLFTGSLCQDQTITCAKLPCENGGTCIQTGVNQVQCVCSSQYVGSTCSINLYIMIALPVVFTLLCFIYLILRKFYPLANNLIIFVLFFTIYDFVVDVLFVLSQFGSILFYPAITFLCVPIFFNLCIIVYVFKRALSHDINMEKWVTSHFTISGAVSLLAANNLDLFLLLNSHVLYNENFKAPLRIEEVNFLSYIGLVGHLLQDAPQLVIQILASIRGSLNTITLLSLIASLLAMLFGIFKRVIIFLAVKCGYTAKERRKTKRQSKSEKKEKRELIPLDEKELKI